MLRECMDAITRFSPAPPRTAGRVDRAARICGHHELMRDETTVEVGCKHLVGQYILVCHLPIRLDLGFRNVGVRSILGSSKPRELLFPAVHLAVGAGELAFFCIARVEERFRKVSDVPRLREILRAQNDLLTVGVVAVLARRRSRISLEQVVERAVLLDDEDDVGNRCSPLV